MVPVVELFLCVVAVCVPDMIVVRVRASKDKAFMERLASATKKRPGGRSGHKSGPHIGDVNAFPWTSMDI